MLKTFTDIIPVLSLLPNLPLGWIDSECPQEVKSTPSKAKLLSPKTTCTSQGPQYSACFGDWWYVFIWGHEVMGYWALGVRALQVFSNSFDDEEPRSRVERTLQKTSSWWARMRAHVPLILLNQEIHQERRSISYWPPTMCNAGEVLLYPFYKWINQDSDSCSSFVPDHQYVKVRNYIWIQVYGTSNTLLFQLSLRNRLIL